MKLWDKKSKIKFAYKGTLTVDDIKKDPRLAPMLTEPVVLYVANGLVYDFRYLSALIGQYAKFNGDKPDIDISDPEKALEEIIRRMNQADPSLPDVAAKTEVLTEQVEANAAAIEELIPIVLGDF